MKRTTPTTRKVEWMVHRREYDPPDPFDNLQEGIDDAREMAELCLRWIKDATELLATQRHGEDK